MPDFLYVQAMFVKRLNVFLLALLFCVLFSAISDSSAMGAPLASYTSPACPTDVATWHIAYRMYWTSSAGQETSRSATPWALEELEQFVDDVRNDSACGVRLSIDVFDEGGSVWPASSQSETVPSDTQSFLSSGHYDWIFYRFPSNGESYCANTGTTGGPAEGTEPSISRFPVDPEGHMGCASGPTSTDCRCEPWQMLMEHEWLHAVVAFYNPRQRWPNPDVHGACEHGYTQQQCPYAMTNENYFADMMQGKVPEDGVAKGIQSDEWTIQGTPASPRIQHLKVRISFGPGPKVAVSLPADLGAPVHLTVNSSSGVVARDEELTESTTFNLPRPGWWSICQDFPVSETYYRVSQCAKIKLRPQHPGRFRRLHIFHHGPSYRIVSRGLPERSHAILLVTHLGQTYRLKGRSRSNTVMFKLWASGEKPWKVRLRVILSDGRVAVSRRYRL